MAGFKTPSKGERSIGQNTIRRC